MKLRAKHCEKAPEQSSWLGAACRDFARPQAHVLDDVQVVAHDRPRVHPAGKNVSQLQDAGFNPRFTVLETFT